MASLTQLQSTDKAGMPHPVPDPPEPGTYHLTFQRQLAASEQIGVLAKLLAHVHWLYEGWGQVPSPLGAELTRIYTKAACLAVRFCSNGVDDKVGTSRAERWALHNYAHFIFERAVATTEEERDQAVRDYARGIIDEHRFHLMQGCELSPRDAITAREME